MKIEEYVECRKKELERFKDNWIENNKKDPVVWPFIDAHKDEWFEQELVFFGVEI